MFQLVGTYVYVLRTVGRMVLSLGVNVSAYRAIPIQIAPGMLLQMPTIRVLPGRSSVCLSTWLLGGAVNFNANYPSNVPCCTLKRLVTNRFRYVGLE